MATYYINADNSYGVYPYNTVEYGVPNFHALLSSVTLNDGDTIMVTSPSGATIVDSPSTININNVVTIKSDDLIKPKVQLNSSGIGMALNMDGSTISGISFFANAYSGNTMINITANNITITKCEFGYNANTISGYTAYINVYKVDGVTISNNVITTPLKYLTSQSTAIYLDNSSYCNILNNKIKMVGSYGQGVAGIGVCNYDNVGFNTIGVFSELDAVDTVMTYGIQFSQQGNYNNIYNNAIGIAGGLSTGILYGINNLSGINVKISNNYIHMYENDFGSTGIYVPFRISNTVSYFDIINNIIEYTGPNNNGIAIHTSFQRGMIDYNDIYNMKITNIILTDSSDLCVKFGKYNIFCNPRLFWSMNPKLDLYDIENYYCYKNSECVGSGYLHHNIGVGVDKSIISKPDNYINIVDTVTNNFGVSTANNTSYNTFFNSVFTESATQFDNVYRGTTDFPYTNVMPDDVSNYPSYLDIQLGVYRNQFGYVLANPSTFPFIVGDHFYNTSLTYVCANKDKLQPFSDIACPPNPGYGFPDYKDYEKGLWGYLRIQKANTCSLDGCIIQDTIADVTRYQDRIENVNIWTQDQINPPCITN